MKLIKNIFIWIFAVLLTATVLYYQRTTGPTYAKKVDVVLNGEETSFKLLRSWANEKEGEAKKGARIALEVEDVGITGECRYKRLGTDDEWTTLKMLRDSNELYVMLPAQPAAGKLLYLITIDDNGKSVELTEEPIVIRFKDWIPMWILPPHILLIFMALLFSTMAAVEALRKGKHVITYTAITLISMLIGGLIMGPLMQKYAFGDYWTGWPFGEDLTDTKTMVAFLVWLIALFVLRKNRQNRFWPIFAAIITLLIFIIPHSAWGSEFDYAAGQVTTGK